MRFFTSDMHHRHRRIVEITNRSIDTTQEQHDTWLIDLWNNQVQKTDEVWHLGDLSFASRYEDIAKFVSKLNGNINLLKGNHDQEKHLNQLKKDGLINNWWDYKEIKIKDTKVCLFHFAISTWNQQGRGSWHLFGHSHGNFKDAKGKMLDVGLDSIYNIKGKHTFFTEDEIVEYMNRQEIHCNDHHKIVEREQL